MVFSAELDKFCCESFFKSASADDRVRQARRMKMMLGKSKIIIDRYFLKQDKRILMIYFFHNQNIRDLRGFYPSSIKWNFVIEHKIRKLVRRLKLFMDFFQNYDYKTIFFEARRVLSQKQYEFLNVYLKCHSVGKSAQVCLNRKTGRIGCSHVAIIYRLKMLLRKLDEMSLWTGPLMNLVLGLKR